METKNQSVQLNVALWTIVVLVIVLIIVVLGSVSVINPLKEQKKQLEENNQLLKMQIDSLIVEVDSLENLSFIYEEKICEKENEIVNLRKKKYEKVDSIFSLTLDESIEFLSRYLSKEGSY